MKAPYHLLFFCLPFLGHAQLLSIDFEGDIVTADFVDFDGGTASVIDNPLIDDNNPSATVAKIVRDGGQVWAGSKILLAENLDFSVNNSIAMKVYSTAPEGTVIKFKLEGEGAFERDVATTVSGQWEELVWDFTGAPPVFDEIVFMFDFGNVGNGSAGSTFYFDDVVQRFGGSQIDLPVDFEELGVNYQMSDFGGNVSMMVVDPTDEDNTVMQVVKTDQAASWAGTTIGTPAGFATDIPLTLADSKMNVRVWSPEAGTPIRLKVEDAADPTHTCETETNTTVGGEWEVITFDFSQEAPGTELLSVGLQMGWTFNMASIFFDFGTEGAVAGEHTYYFDDVRFGSEVLSTTDVGVHSDMMLYPNPAHDSLTLSGDAADDILSISIYDGNGRLVRRSLSPSPTMVIKGLAPGIYPVRIACIDGVHSLLLYKI